MWIVNVRLHLRKELFYGNRKGGFILPRGVILHLINESCNTLWKSFQFGFRNSINQKFK